MNTPRLSNASISDFERFLTATAQAWTVGGLIKPNSYGVELLVAPRPGADFESAAVHQFGFNRPGSQHGANWYIHNASGKNLICLETGMDSRDAVRLWEGLVRQIDGAFPWGGAIIDQNYGLIIGTSGFKEDEDVLFSRTLRNRLVMMLDREGRLVLDDTHGRGEQEGDASADRFTRAVST